MRNLIKIDRVEGLERVSAVTAEEVFKMFKTSPSGLSDEEAERRLKRLGLNVLRERKKTSPIYKVVGQFRDLFTILLIFAAALAAVSNLQQISFVITAVVFINVGMSLAQEARAEKAIEALKAWVPYRSKVIRGGEMREIPAANLVVGDLIVLEEGDRIPADARLVEDYNLFVNNVPLTGESEPQPRTSKPVPREEQHEIDVANMVFMSTSVSRGYGKAVVTSTGMETRIGKIASLTQEIQDVQSPLQREIAHAAKYDFAIATAIGFLFFLLGYFWLRLELIVDVLFMIGVMVACVPEGLQVTVSSALAISVQKMARENVLIRKLSSVQTLGSTTVICTDKTGTITKGEMTVTKIWTPDVIVDVSGIGYEPEGEFTIEGRPLGRREASRLAKVLEAGLLCNNATLLPPSDQSRLWRAVGDPTDGAFLTVALKANLNIQETRANSPRIAIIPFDSDRKMMTSIHKVGKTSVAYVKGAPRSILNVSSRILIEGAVKTLTKMWVRTVEDRIRHFGEMGLRVVALAYRTLKEGEEIKAENVEKGLILIGLAALRDPPRPEVREAVEVAKKAGIRVIMITGDYAETARAIAQEVGIAGPDETTVIKGQDLQRMTDEEAIDELDRCRVIARATPEQKLRVVSLLKKRGEVVAVTGDGANDAPSLRKADIGVAMGVSGTDVAKEASEMVLLDDSFASIVKAIEMGRAVYDNIRKFVIYVFSHNWAELIPYLLYILIQIPLPLMVVQILAIDLAIDVLPSLALSVEPAEPGTMERPPRSVSERIFNASTLLRSLFTGSIIAACAMYGCLSTWLAGGWRLGQALAPQDPVYLKGVTMTFAGIVVAQMGNVISCRTNLTSILRLSFRSNKWILLGILSQLTILTMIIYAPPLQPIFGTTGLETRDWLILIASAVIVVAADEVRKLIARSRATRLRALATGRGGGDLRGPRLNEGDLPLDTDHSLRRGFGQRRPVYPTGEECPRIHCCTIPQPA